MKTLPVRVPVLPAHAVNDGVLYSGQIVEARKGVGYIHILKAGDPNTSSKWIIAHIEDVNVPAGQQVVGRSVTFNLYLHSDSRPMAFNVQ
jgi:hypothetical protein